MARPRQGEDPTKPRERNPRGGRDDAPQSLRTRRARLRDHLELCHLWSQVDTLHARIRPDFFAPGGEPARSKAYLDRILADADQEILVAVRAGKIVGLIHLQLYDTPPSPVFSVRRRAHVEDLVVDRAQRRQGVGRALLGAGQEWARWHHAAQVVLTVWQGNEAAERFYESMGYRVVSRVMAQET